MADNRELEAKIAALAGRINLHKQQEQIPHHGQIFSSPGYGRGRGGPSWAPHHGTPYGYPRGRAGKSVPPAHRHRTLVINSVPPPAQETKVTCKETISAPEVIDTPGSTPTWVSKRDRHMQLINTSVYDQLSQQRARSMAATLEQKQHERDLREKAKLSKHFQNTSTQYYRSAAGNTQVHGDSKVHEIQIDGIRFQVTDGGSKLIRVSGDSNPAHATPKQAKIGGVTFFRSKNGNLYRAGLIKAKKRHEIKKIDEPCLRFTTTGSCSKGPHCRFIHNPHKVAICKDYLLKGECPFGNGCDLSHQSTPHRVPACVHFLRGNCTNEKCRYAHVRVNPAAPVCRTFARLGYCDKGAECADRHVFECPDYANKGFCRNETCRLPHVDRAGQIRKSAAAESISASDAEKSPDLTSDEEDFDQIDSDDIDSDGLEDVFLRGAEGTRGHELSQQQDYVQF